MNIEDKKKDYQGRLNKAIADYEKLGVLIRQLEGAIFACDEIIKESKDTKEG